MPAQKLIAANKKVLDQLAPDGVLRAGIYSGNFLLVTGKNASGEPVGISPDLAKSIADCLAVQCGN
jgi:polar amino acid transport system substrate-binding protein